MAISIDLGSGAGSTNGDTLYAAFAKINNFLSSVTRENNGDLNINGVKIGRGGSSIDRNTAVGSSTLLANTTGYSNTAVGVGALLNSTIANFNTAVGSDALFYNTTGFANNASGINSLLNNTTGSRNSGIGSDSLSTNTVFDNCSGLGAGSQTSASNQVQLGDSATTTYVYGTVQNRSDLRDKADVRDTVLGLDFISKLRAVDYKWDMREDYKSEMPLPLKQDATEQDIEAHKLLMNEWLESVKLDNINHDGTHKRSRFHHGLIAQEVKQVIEESGVDFGGFQDHSFNGGQEVLSIGYDELIAPMIKAIQELKAEVEFLKSK